MDDNNSSSASDSAASSAAASGSSLAHIEAIKHMREELRLEIVPQRLLRQYSVNIPPRCASEIGGASALHSSPRVVEDMLERWERNREKWRRAGSSDSLADPERQADSPLASRVDLPAPPKSTPTPAADAAGSPMVAAPVRRRSSLFRANEVFEVTFGEGFLGLEFVLDEAKCEVVVLHVQNGVWNDAILAMPPGATLTRGLTVEAVGGTSLSACSPQTILELLQYSARPMTVRFRRNTKAVVCKLCECKVDAFRLNEHTDYCVMSKRFEIEADVINNSLMKLVTSINANLSSEPVRPYFHEQDVHFYHTMRVVAIQAASCDVSRIDSFALCCRLIKIIDRIREHEHETSSFVVDRGLKYCGRIRNLIHAKMSKMRLTHKVMFQQEPYEVVRGPLQRTKSLEDIDVTSRAVPATTSATTSRPTAYRVSIRDFQIVKPISKGAFGKVYLARKKTTGDQYAIKVLAKEHLKRKKQIQQIEMERNILAQVQSPFVVKLFWTFQSRRNLFLVMEYLPGGDFMSLLECIVQLEEQVACVYIAEIAIALNHLHSKGCVHRDLKPDNILISSTGHIKLTDFGLSEAAMTELEIVDSDLSDEHLSEALSPLEQGRSATDGGEFMSFTGPSSPPTREELRSSRIGSRQSKLTNHTNGRCGTPDYLSPEIILGHPHGPPVDYWALGVILYEMLVGFPPFNDDTVEAIFANILERNILWPDGEKCISAEAMDLIDRLLDPDPESRLGWEGVVAHPFFTGVDWDTILEAVPPFVPTLEGPNDTSYFNNRNLTDIFIDDDEFEIDSRSFDSTASRDQVASTASDTQQGDEEAIPEDGAICSTRDQKPDNQATAKGASSGQTSQRTRIEDPAEDAHYFQAFRSFSYTNMNALAAASRTEAELLADEDLIDTELSASCSILI